MGEFQRKHKILESLTTRWNLAVAGAIIGEWVPGGYTKNGTAEAALVGAENIVHNKNMNQLLNNFPGMWEKIK